MSRGAEGQVSRGAEGQTPIRVQVSRGAEAGPVSYEWVQRELEGRVAWGGFFQVHRELGGKRVMALTGAEVGRALKETIQALAEEFPVYGDFVEDVAYEFECGERTPADGVPELADFIAWGGLSLEREWQDLGPVERLVLAVCDIGGGWYEHRVGAWWEALRPEYGLPPLEEVTDSVGEVLARLERLPPPWDGLWATYQWFEGPGANRFVDIAPEEYACCGGYEPWTMENIRELAAEYAWAETHIFGPAANLEAMVAADPAVFGICLDLCLGRLEALIQDGELIFTDDAGYLMEALNE